MEKITTFFASYINVFGWNDLLDIIITSFAIYWLIRFIHQTKAETLAKGIVFLIVVLQLSGILNLNVVNFILASVMQVGLLAVIVVFQPEFRKALEHVGKNKFRKIFGINSSDEPDSSEETVTEICDAVKYMSEKRIGSLIVIPGQMPIENKYTPGIRVNGDITKELLVNIFYPNTPLHDGAAIISNGKVEWAACILPLTQNDNLNSELGTRHRAAIGMSESSDATVIVVSEETGKISVARRGDLARSLNYESLKKILVKEMVTPAGKKEGANKK
ncbi:MAG: diadenylate cyclase CdaA [Clostridia bacterium]|nr:diadenylate cyclase CdaA [Clostridia bacterium]